jgi:hypothetical protein
MQVDLGCHDGADPSAGEPIEAAVRLALCGDTRLAPRWFDKVSLVHLIASDCLGLPRIASDCIAHHVAPCKFD